MTQQPHGTGSQDTRSTPTETVNNARNFWKTTGCATILAAAIGLGGTLITQLFNKSAPLPPTPTLTQEKTSSPSRNPTESSAPPPGDPGVRWSGRFSFTTAPDFDSVPPKDKADNYYSLQGAGGHLEFTTGKGSRWTAPTLPTKQQCSDQIDTQSEQKIPSDAGTQICLRNQTGRVVYFKVLSAEQDGSLSRYQTDVIIWNN